jgi:mannose-6-phosphate isomerase-like protein (cupin superfamily)
MSYVGDGDRDALLIPEATQPGMQAGKMRGRTIASVRQTQGKYSLYRIDLAPEGGGASPHFHRTFAEVFHVLAGVVQLYDGHQWVDGAEGDHLFIPEGSIHGFRNVRPEPATLLMMSVPGAPRERYFAELAKIASGEKKLQSAEEWTAFFAEHDQVMVES